MKSGIRVCCSIRKDSPSVVRITLGEPEKELKCLRLSIVFDLIQKNLQKYEGTLFWPNGPGDTELDTPYQMYFQILFSSTNQAMLFVDEFSKGNVI